MAVTGLLLVVYGLTMPPSLSWGHHGADGGDLATAVVLGRLPHPPGFPTYLLLGRLFVLFPLGDPAWRLSLLSALMAAGAAGLTANTVFSLASSIEDARALAAPAALTSGLALGLAPLLWSQALIVEVYAPAAFFSAGVIWLAAIGAPGWALGLAWGLGLGLHPILLFLAPLLLAVLHSPVVWARHRRCSGCAGAHASTSVRYIALVGLMAALGWGATAGPLLLAFGGSPSPWGDVGTLHGWWDFVSGRLYHGYLFALSPSAWPLRTLAAVGLLARQFTPLGLVLAGWGWDRLRRGSPFLAWGSAAAFAAFGLYALLYDTADSLVYLAPALPLAALWLGTGLTIVAAWLRRRWRGAAWLLLLLPLLQLALFWRAMDLSDDVAAMAWAEGVLAEAPADAALLTAEDAHTFTLWYARDALGMRPDVVVIDVDLWAYGPYRRHMTAELGLLGRPVGLSAQEAARQSGRPVVDVSGHFRQMR